jgi:phage/plasmid-like protein (TIGR03299 family)
MAHMIDSYVGRRAAWHGLGEVTGVHFNYDQLLAANNGALAYTVEVVKMPGAYGEAVESYATYRVNRNGSRVFLNNVGKGFNASMHHSEGFKMTDALMATADGAHYETAGSLGKGERVWALADLGLTIRVGDDLLKNYLGFVTAYDGSMSFEFRNFEERIVCHNTWTIAMSEKAKNIFRVRHTKNGQVRLDDAKAALLTLGADNKSVEEKLNFLVTRKVTKDTMLSILGRLFPNQKDDNGKERETTRRENQVAQVLANYESCDDNAFPEQRGSAYNLLNAITEYTDHQRSSRGDMRAESAMFGSGNALKTKAYEIILESANGMPLLESKQIIYPVAARPMSVAQTTTYDSSLLDAIMAEAS